MNELAKAPTEEFCELAVKVFTDMPELHLTMYPDSLREVESEYHLLVMKAAKSIYDPNEFLPQPKRESLIRPFAAMLKQVITLSVAPQETKRIHKELIRISTAVEQRSGVEDSLKILEVCVACGEIDRPPTTGDAATEWG